MMKRSAVALAFIALTSGCMGARVPKLAKCAGPYRFANPTGTVLPSLPVPGQPQPAAAAPSAPPISPPSPPAAPGPPTSDEPINAGPPGASSGAPSAGPKPVTTGSLLPYYPSC